MSVNRRAAELSADANTAAQLTLDGYSLEAALSTPIRYYKGETGNGIDYTTLNDDYTLTFYYTDGTSFTTESIRGKEFTFEDFTPEQLELLKGEDGFDPIVELDKEEGVVTFRVTDATHTSEVQIVDGKDGTDGKDGKDAEVTKANVLRALGYTPVTPNDFATYSTPGLVKPGTGLSVDSSGAITVSVPYDAYIKGRYSSYALTCSKIDLAVKEGLTNCKISWTDEEKTKARDLLGMSNIEDDLYRRIVLLEQKEETDPTVPAWAKQPNKPTYTPEEVNALPSDTFIPSKVSDLDNDSQFIVNTVDNLTNYYKKSETYNKTEVNRLIDNITTLNILIVESLPTEGISTTTIYLIKRDEEGLINSDSYDEYIYVNNKWELIGTTAIDLSDYPTLTRTNELIQNYVETNVQPQINSKVADVKLNGETVVVNNIANLDIKQVKYDEPAEQLVVDYIEGVPTKVSDLDNDAGYVKNTDYATLSSGGVVKINPNNGFRLIGNETLTLQGIPSSVIDNRDTDYRSGYFAISPSNADYMVKQAMCDGKGADWTPQEQAAVRKRLGFGGKWEQLLNETINTTLSVQIPKNFNDILILTYCNESSIDNSSGNISFYKNNERKVSVNLTQFAHPGRYVVTRITNVNGYVTTTMSQYSTVDPFNVSNWWSLTGGSFATLSCNTIPMVEWENFDSVRIAHNNNAEFNFDINIWIA